MWNQNALRLVGAALAIALIPACAWNQTSEAEEDSTLAPVATGAPTIPEQHRVTSIEQIMPGARYYIEHGMQIEKGERVLIIASSTVGDPLVTEAWARAARERGAIVDVANLDLASHRPTPEEGPLRSKASSWWPTWIEHAIQNSDATIVLTAINVSHGIDRTLVLEQWNRGRIGLPGSVYSREQLAFTDWTTYPAELDIALQKKVYEKISVDGGPKRVRFTDPLGTDLTFTLDVDRDWVRKNFPTDLNLFEATLRQRTEYMFHHLKMTPGLSKKADARGTVVATSTVNGPVARLEFRIEGGRVVEVIGDGPEAEQTRREIEKYSDVNYGFPHGKGAAWVAGVYLGGNPKIVRNDYFNPRYFEEQGTYNYWWSDSKRSGFGHINFGTGADGLRIDQSAWHETVFIPFPTMTVNGETIVENGHLLALDDPEIRRIAAKYGDPDELLREKWIPNYDDDPSIRGHYSKAQYREIRRALKLP